MNYTCIGCISILTLIKYLKKCVLTIRLLTLKSASTNLFNVILADNVDLMKMQNYSIKHCINNKLLSDIIL